MSAQFVAQSVKHLPLKRPQTHPAAVLLSDTKFLVGVESAGSGI